MAIAGTVGENRGVLDRLLPLRGARCTLRPVTSGEILVVDDDATLVDMLSMALENEGFSVGTARDGKAGWERFCELCPDLVVLDLLMPELDGIELCRRIRTDHVTPIIMLTSRDQEMDKVLGLEVGADDYVTKPFSTRELIARIRAAMRRATIHVSDERRQVRSLAIDRGRREVQCAGRTVALTATEFELLWLLTSEPGRVFSREFITDGVYGNQSISDRSIDTFVKRLRQKLGDCEPGWDEIETVRGVGYRYRA